MLSGNQVKHIQSLRQKKFREIHHQFVAEGSKLITDILDSQFKIVSVYALSDWLNKNETLLHLKKSLFNEVSLGEMERITALSSPSPVLAIVEIPDTNIPQAIIHDLVLVLDDIKDPGNLGTIIRIADWFGIGSIVCSETTVDLYNPKVIQATMGSIARVDVTYADLPKFLSSIDASLKKYGTFPEGKNIYSAVLDQKGIIIIGNESFGISPEVVAKVTDKICIPSYPAELVNDHHAESLNASIATAIICSEFRRRKS